jgi:hypothetical protein
MRMRFEFFLWVDLEILLGNVTDVLLQVGSVHHEENSSGVAFVLVEEFASHSLVTRNVNNLQGSL